jgi:triosephosphate isomerase
MRRPVFYACWKSNKTRQEVLEFFKAVEAKGLSLQNKTEVVLAPCPVYLELAKTEMPAPLQLGGQDVCELGSGGRMGEVTAKILKEYGVRYCAVGHREKRERGETDSIINKKIKALFANGITPMLCVGENLQEYDSNMTREVLKKQIHGALADIDNVEDILVCYRPSWTLGTGYVANGDFVNMVAEYIRNVVMEMKDNPLDASFPILYGGNVTPANVKEYMSQSNVDGVFFVSSALSANDFYGVIENGTKQQ